MAKSPTDRFKSPISKLNFQVSDVLRLIISGNSINESASSGISSGSDGESAEPKREKLYNSRPALSSSNSTAPVPVPSTSSTAPAPVPSSSNVMSQIRRFFRPSTSIMSVSFMKHCLKLSYYCIYFDKSIFILRGSKLAL